MVGERHREAGSRRECPGDHDVRPHPCKSLLLLGQLLLLPTAGAADVSHEDNSYFAVAVNYADLDELRGIDGEGTGASFLYGFRLTDNFFLETRLTGLVLERGDAGGTDFYQQDLGVDAVYRFNTGNGWQPFASLGLAVIRNDVEVAELDDVGAGGHAGLGIASPPLGDMGMRVRLDVRYVHDDYLDGMQDTRIGIGIQVPLGRRSVTAPKGGAPSTATGNDTDGDGIPDHMDRCANSLPYVKHDTTGCMLPDQTIRMYEVTFNNGTAILTSAAREELSPLVLALRDQPDLHVRVDGHTDSLGGAEANRLLSRERAEAVATYLALQGVPTQRISTKGFGEGRPVESNATAAGRERNRRIEIVLLAPPAR